jgi:putative ABC transport system ATP-binding protein
MAVTAANPIIELRQASRCYAEGAAAVAALDAVDLQIERGRTLAILGSSGSGKSTLLNILGCLDRLTSGSYLLNGEDIGVFDDDHLSSVRLDSFGFIFQSFNLIPQLNILENIELPLYYAGVSAEVARERSKYLSALMGLDERWLHRPSQLSGGQQQRVAIARALANDPAILLADEPTGNLDSTTGKQILEVLYELAAAGKTLIMVTHDQQIAAYMQRRIYLRDGRIVRSESGSVSAEVDISAGGES